MSTNPGLNDRIAAGIIKPTRILHGNASLGVYISMKSQRIGRLGLAITASLACCYLAYGFTHPPKPRAFRYQGVNSMRRLSIVFTNVSVDQQRVFPEKQ